MRPFLLFFIFLLTACTPTSPPQDAPTPIFNFYLASGTEKIIPAIYDCAERTQIGLAARTPDINAAEISFRLTAPQNEETRAYQVGSVEILLVTTHAPPFNNLSNEQIREVFMGKIDNWSALGGEEAEIQLWVYGEGNELQDAFNEAMLTTGRISSNARQAQNPEAMRESLLENSNAIGILPRAMAGDDFQIIASIATPPLLAYLDKDASDALEELILCLQSN